MYLTTTKSQKTKKAHHGKNVKRLREILDIKQVALGNEIGLSQQSMSRLEKSQSINDKTLMDIAKTINIPIDVIKNFDDNKFITSIEESFKGNHFQTSTKKTKNRKYAFDASFDEEKPLLQENLNDYDVSSKKEKDKSNTITAKLNYLIELFEVLSDEFNSLKEIILTFQKK